MTSFLGILFVASLAGAAILTPLAIAVSRRLGFLDLPGPRKIHTVAVPYGGGVAVAAAVLLTTLGALRARGPAPPHLPGTPKTFSYLLCAAGSVVILALGLVDDRRKLSPRVKLAVEAVVAAGVALGGERLQLFGAPVPLSIAITMLWILGITNAFNLLDHMDGLCAGVAVLSGIAFLAVAIQTGQEQVAAMLVPLLGACAGFLLYNFPPARIFLGDAGSLFIGFWISCLTISFTFYTAPYPLYTYLVPLAILAVPLYDTGSVVVIRLVRRRPIFEGDTNHLAHRLTALGFSRRGAVLTVYALTLIAGLSAVLLYQVRQAGACVILSQLLLTFGIMTLLESQGHRP
jgi:UDP-GlcNAc:undecaprenyl-phosphate GlcNAc-1-phosphate transferase